MMHLLGFLTDFARTALIAPLNTSGNPSIVFALHFTYALARTSFANAGGKISYQS